MRKVFFLFLCGILILPFHVFGKDDTLLLRLDKVLKERTHYDARKDQKLDSLRSLLSQSTLSGETYRLRDLLAGEYKLYIADSAMVYLEQNLELARRLQWKDRITESLLKEASSLSVSGMYKEALDKLGEVQRESISEDLLPLWYDTGRQIYSFMHTYSYQDKYAGDYLRQEKLYRDSLLMVLPPSSPVFQLYQAEEFYAAGQLGTARKELLALIDTLPDTSNIYARAAFTLAYIYRDEGHPGLYIDYLALSAISDVRASVKENAALQYLAVALYEKVDIDRAYRYIRSSLEDAIFCNARLRTVEISRMLPVIDAAYTSKVRQQRQQLIFFLVLVSVLSVFLIVALAGIRQQVKKLRSTQEKLRQANHIKEEYIGHFLDLCSVYIEKLYHFRRTVHRKITAGQHEELLRLTKSAQRSDAEQQELHANFDRAFLHLYPHFVKEFNELLQPGERYTLRSDELLNTEMRIYAFIRLGIDDTTKIAGFLHYSVNTIYTYRNKVKNKAIDREKFEQQVMKIGLV